MSEEERIRLGQSTARGNTGDGESGVAPGEQGISNRPGDLELSEGTEDDPTEELGDDLDDELEDDEFDEEDTEEDETDPDAEPGEPI